MLHAVAQLAEDHIGHIRRVLGNEIDPNPLGPDQPRHLLDLRDQRAGRVGEQQVRLVEEEHQLRLVGVADLGHLLEKLGQQPQQERRVKPRRLHQLVGGEDVDPPCPGVIQPHQIGEVQRRFAEHRRRPLVFQNQKPPLDRPDRGRRHKAIARRNGIVVLGDEGQECLQVLQIEQRQLFLVRQPESDVQHALLRLGQLHQARQQERPHLGHGRTHRVALFAKEIPERDRERPVLQVQPDSRRPFHERGMQLVIGRACLCQTRNVALDVGQEHRHARRRKAFGQNLQRHRLACAGGPGDQPVTVAVFQQ